LPTNPKEYYPPMHTAEHILNQTMVRMFGTERSFSNHIERRKSKCDYHFSRDLTEDERVKLQTEINKVIDLNLPITEEVIDINEASSSFNLEKIPENSGNEIRIIRVGNYDACPCSGIHVSNTSEIGNVRIISSSFNNDVLRIRFKLQNKSV
jgi:Ser-tRNA(Ala) deacylase AlaX